MKAFVRWALFLLIGLPIQILVYALYPLVVLYWRIFVFEKHDLKELPSHVEIPVALGLATRNGGLFLDNNDNHGAFTMFNFITEEGYSQLLDAHGNFIRRSNETGGMNRDRVSGDVVIAFAFANLFYKAKDDDIRRAIKNYFKFLGTRSYDDISQGDVSNRCNNFGVNYCPDSDFYKMGQPAFGPQFYTNSCLLAMGYHLGIGYKLAFWVHWLVMGGWLWAWAPTLYTKSNGLWYVRDMSMKALWVHAQVFGDRWWIRKPMKFINDKISTHENQLFDAMFGEEPENLPACMHAFFSQNENASSEGIGNGRVSAYIPDALKKIARTTKLK
jgi:hypothetical protein